MDDLLSQIVVVDVEAPYVYVGTLAKIADKTIVLDNADVHDLRDSSTTRERYVIDTRIHGVRPNRNRVFVQQSQIVSVSLLADVMD